MKFSRITATTLTALALALAPVATANADTRPLCPQGEDHNGAIPRILNCQMWISGSVGDDDGNGLVSEDESGWPAITARYAADTTPACWVDDAYAREVGDDNCDGHIVEDESGWDCATMGNMVCGPGVVRHENLYATGLNAWDEGAYVGGYN